MKLLNWLLEAVFPSKCILCGKKLKKGEEDLCDTCCTDAPWYPGKGSALQFLDSFAPVWYYERNVRSSILRYKFQNRRSYAAGYGRLLAAKLQEEYPEGFDCITWVPISRLRKFRRGYDQVELLANAVGEVLGVKPRPLLKKIRHNPPQSGIRGFAQRRANVLGAYRVAEGEPISGRILLLDDVITTGATAGECARILLTAGAAEVHCAALAKTRKHE